MKHQDALPRDEMVEFVMSCWDEDAGENAVAHADESPQDHKS